MRKRNLIMVAGACLAALSMITPSALADPSPLPPPHRPLQGVGSDTTQDVMNALADVITGPGGKQIASWDASPIGSSITTGTDARCTITRPSGSGNGVTALRRSLTNGDNCLHFARSSSNSASTIPSVAPRLSLVPFAVDGLTYAIRSDGTVPIDLTRAEIQAIYNCAPEWQGLVKPLLPQFGSGTRSSFISLILGLSDSADFAATRPCISERDGAGRPLLENTGILLTDKLHIAPYSAAQYNAQINRVISDVHGRTVLGSVNAVAPNVVNTLHAPAGLTYAVRDDSGVFLDLSRDELADIYRANGTPGSSACQSVRPLLPPAGSQRTAFLNALGVATPGSCVTTVASENDGRQLTNAGHILPYSIDTYNRQVNRVILDVHGRAVLGSINAISPNVLNTAQLGVRTVYNVIPSNRETVAPTSTVFVGTGSQVCSNPNVITRQGFALLPSGQCGVITDRRG